jgi:glutathione peroxidase
MAERLAYALRKLRVFAALAFFIPGFKAGAAPARTESEYRTLFDIPARTIEGKETSLGEYRGKVVLVANTASKCGFTPQFKSLETIYNRYRDQGFVVLGFPSNDFFRQDPGSNEEIKSFCENAFGVTFPLFEKAPVTGEEKQPVFKFLTEQQPDGLQGRVWWNFEKFLVDRSGRLIARWRSRTDPTAAEITSKIEQLLAAGPCAVTSK